MAKKSIILVGPMGVGKSTIGRMLADLVKLPFEDTDRLIESRTGADIPWIFDVEGEEGFRQRESAALNDLLKGDPGVVATGGGIVLKPENRSNLILSGTVIYLTAAIDQLVARTSKDKKRPLLQVADPEAKIRELILQRDPLYREVADKIIATDRRGPRSVAQEIARFYEGES